MLAKEVSCLAPSEDSRMLLFCDQSNSLALVFTTNCPILFDDLDGNAGTPNNLVPPMPEK